MKAGVLLSPKESRRAYVVEQLIAGSITVAQAASVLDLSTRQVKRLKKGVKEFGIAFLAHGNRGRRPKHSLTDEVKAQVVSLALDPDKYKGANCQHMSELLREHEGICVSARSILRILNEAKIPTPHRKRRRKSHRSRDRLPAPGMMVQCDASLYHWFGDRGPQATLHGIVDDATGQVLALYFRPTEDSEGYAHVIRQMILQHGIPASICTDRHTIFLSPDTDKLTVEEELSGVRVPLTQLGRSINELGITHIPVRSPQSKGRIERLWETLQGRLVIELRLAGVSNIEEANAFLPEFIKRYNRRFAVEPAESKPAFRPCPSVQVLDLILCKKEERTATAGSTISFCSRHYQLTTSSGAVLPLRRGTKITVLIHLDGHISAGYNGQEYALRECPAPKRSSKTRATRQSDTSVAQKPAADHPWRQPPKRQRRRRGSPEPYEGFWKDVYGTTLPSL